MPLHVGLGGLFAGSVPPAAPPADGANLQDGRSRPRSFSARGARWMPRSSQIAWALACPFIIVVAFGGAAAQVPPSAPPEVSPAPPRTPHSDSVSLATPTGPVH